MEIDTKLKITSDGELFIRALEATYDKSRIKEKKDIEKLPKKTINSFFSN